MIAEYEAGRTPNPDVLCNKEIKFGAFWKKAKEMGADFIATGHYARIEEKKPATPMGRLVEGKDKEKDQSYFLWTMKRSDLPHVLFPVGSMEKNEVRKLARQYNLPVSEKKDSQGICFIGDVSMDEFLAHFISTKSGNVLNRDEEVIGTHRGAIFYTIGERHGFDITQKKSDDGAFYILSKDMKANTITVSNKEPEITSLSPTKIMVTNINWITEPTVSALSARIRYRGEKLPATLFLYGKKLGIEFTSPVRGLSLGQSIVFYLSAQAGDGDICLGGAVMDKVIE